MQTAIHVGHTADSVENARKAILDIIDASVGDDVKKAALTALTAMLGIKDTIISGCTLYGDKSETHNHYAAPEPEGGAEFYAEDFPA